MKHHRLLEEALRSLPKGFKVELSGELVIAQAPPSSIHQLNLAIVQRQFEVHCPPGYFPTGNSDLSSSEADAVRNPDLTCLPEDVIELGREIPAELALIAVEVASPYNPDNDWTGKVRDYPRMGLPLYLIVDPREKAVTLFSEPTRERYRTRTEREFGDTIRIPAPFDFELDLSRLVPYRGTPISGPSLRAKPMKSAQAWAVNASWGPVLSLESRTWTVASARATSTQAPPSVPLWLDLNQASSVLTVPPPAWR